MKIRNLFLVTVILLIALFFTGKVFAGGTCEEKQAKEENLKNLLPSSCKEMPGWKILQAAELYETYNLWDLINGQAEMYIDYGFKRVVTEEYAAVDDSGSIMVEIYQMEDHEKAFGIYAAERSSDENYINMGTGGYLGEYYLNFWKGPYYVKLTSFKTSPDTGEKLFNMAESVANKIKGNYSMPGLFALFPRENMVKMSERFIPKNFLGLNFLSNGHRVDYMNEGGGFQLFLVETGSLREAGDAFNKFKDFLLSENEELSIIDKGEYQLIRTKKGKAVFFHGPFLGGVLNNSDLSGSERIIEQLVNNLKQDRV